MVAKTTSICISSTAQQRTVVCPQSICLRVCHSLPSAQDPPCTQQQYFEVSTQSHLDRLAAVPGVSYRLLCRAKHGRVLGRKPISGILSGTHGIDGVSRIERVQPPHARLALSSAHASATVLLCAGRDARLGESNRYRRVSKQRASSPPKQ